MTEHVPTPHLTDPTILLTLTGPDRPGVSTALFDCLSAFALEVVDVEQLVVRGRLVLSALVTRPEKHEGLSGRGKVSAAPGSPAPAAPSVPPPNP